MAYRNPYSDREIRVARLLPQAERHKLQRKPTEWELTEYYHRHKRTHDRPEGGADGSYNLSGEDEGEYSGEDQLGSVEEASPSSENAYAHTSLNAVTSNTMSPPTSVPSGPTYNNLQTLSMPMTMSTPQTVNAGTMM